MQQLGSKYFASRPPPHYPWGWGQKAKILLFQNMAQVAYQMLGNHEMQQHGSK